MIPSVDKTGWPPLSDTELAGPSSPASISDFRGLLRKIVSSYDSRITRAYCKTRFMIININILDVLALCLRGRQRVLDIGCGFGLFGCYFSALFPDLSYVGYDLNPKRIEMAGQAAARLGLKNAEFRCGDVRQLALDEQYDAILMVDLLHHLDDVEKRKLIDTCARHLSPGGRLIIKDVTTRPFPKIAFTWALDVLMTRGFEMWYWDEQRFHLKLKEYFNRIDTFPITDWLPYPHVVYLSENMLLPSYPAQAEEKSS